MPYIVGMVASNGQLPIAAPSGAAPAPPATPATGSALLRAPSEPGQSPAPPAQLPEHDRALVNALTAPSPEGDALLAEADPLELADWFERPGIQRALAAAQAVRDRRLRAKATQRAEHAMDRLTAVLDTATDLEKPEHLSETRRAASTLLRITTQYLYWSEPCRRSALADRRSEATPRTQDAGPRTQDSSPQHAARSTQHGPHRPPPPPPPAEPPLLDTTSPAATVRGILAVFRTLPHEAPRAATKLIEPALARQIRFGDGLREHFMTCLQFSPALARRNCLARVEPVKIDGKVATQRVVYTRPDGPEAGATFHLVRDDPIDTFGVTRWLLHAVIADEFVESADTS